ncbi:cytochrome-c peroxidase [Corallococcus sp. EGB]|uniref:cytochrome-c peroxidase n=1 Tax=Corallococcus sp. EGB TaxID=1521117 RepID=UPI001CBD41EC|nr:cytochrome c peroxidase [Corallococcus sp. EGB]
MHGSRSWWRVFLPLMLGGAVACEVVPAPGAWSAQAPADEGTGARRARERVGALQASATFEATLREEAAPERGGLKPVERLGKLLFFDRRLSEPTGQACAFCHDPEVGWTGPDPRINASGAVYEGAVQGRFGNRKPSSAAYAAQAPILHRVTPGEADFVGGNFLDGRATGEALGNPAADQARSPFLNPVEQDNPSEAAVVVKVCEGPYGELFRTVWGARICGDVPRAYDSIAGSIAAYEGSREVNAFSSRYDAYLAGRARLTPQEQWGLKLFEGKAHCVNCHPSQRGARGEPPLFTDSTFDNLGVPRNLLNPWYWQLPFNPDGPFWIDPGLGGFLQTRQDSAPLARANLGKVKVPTLRNVDKRPFPGFTKAYMHNGSFKSLESVVHFYNTRDVLPVCLGSASGSPGVDCWPMPEVGLNINTEELGNLGLSPQEEQALVAFLRTLSDGYVE